MINKIKQGLYLVANVLSFAMICSIILIQYYFYNNSFSSLMILMLAAIVLINPIANIFRKTKKVIKNPIYNILKKEYKPFEKSNQILFLLVIAGTSFLPLLSSIKYQVPISLISFLITMITVYKSGSSATKNQMQFWYILIFIISLLTKNVIAVAIIIKLYLELDNFERN